MPMKRAQSVEVLMRQAFGGADSYGALFLGTTPGANVRHAVVWNPGDSGQIVQLRDLRVINLQTSGITGVACRFNLFRITAAPTGGTTVTPYRFNTRTPALSSSIVVERAATGGATETDLLVPLVLGLDEVTDVSGNQFGDALWLPYGFAIEPYTANPGEGFVVRQTTSTVVGAPAFLAAFNVVGDN